MVGFGKALAIGAIAVILSTSGTNAAAPANDSYALAQEIVSLAHPVYGTTEDATAQPGERGPSASLPARKTVWYRYRATRTGVALLLMSDNLYGAGSLLKRHFVDVFRGQGFAATNRIAAASPENIPAPYSTQVVRLSFPTVAGAVYHIRVGGDASCIGSCGLPFRFHLRQFGPAGGVVAFPLFRVAQEVLPVVAFAGIGGSWFHNSDYSADQFILANTTTKTAAVDASLDIDGTVATVHEPALEARTGDQPGVSLVSLDMESTPHGRLSGVWHHTLTLRAIGTGLSRTIELPIIVHKYLQTRRLHLETVGTNRLDARVGQSDRIRLRVTNTSAKTVTGCGLRALSDFVPVTLGWRADGAAADNLDFTLAPRQSRMITLTAVPHFVGTAAPVSPLFACADAAPNAETDANDVMVTGRR